MISFEEIEKKYGKIVIKWDFEEFERAEKGDRWFIGMGIIGGLFLLYAILTVNLLFILIILLTYFIIFLRQYQRPRTILFAITELGIIVDDTFYPFHEIKKFWVLYNPPNVQNVYFELKQAWSPVKRIPLIDVNPLYIRDLLEPFVLEDLQPEDEDFSEALGRVLKL